jgi:Cu/Ag efflux pump CusA
MAYQEKQAAGTTGPVFAFAIVMVFLFLAAQYESWLTPVGVVLSVPMGVLGAMLFVWRSGAANDVYSSIGLVLLVGLIAKNAILIVEFARQQRSEGNSIHDAAIEAAHLRLRPVLMTAFSFILGVLPLVLSSGAGAASRVSLGTAVFGGMLIGTSLGVCVVPAFFVVFQRFSEWWRPVPAVVEAGVPAMMPPGDGSTGLVPEYTETPMPAAMPAEDGSATPAPTPTEDGSAVPAPERTETPTGERR